MYKEYFDHARTIRSAMDAACTYLTDAQALEVQALYPKYEDLTAQNKTVDQGFRFLYNDALWKTEQAKHTFNDIYAPGIGTESLFSKVASPVSGTLDRPIEYSGNMALESGKYYTQNNVIYRCIRDTGTAVYNQLSALAALYVEVVT